MLATLRTGALALFLMCLIVIPPSATAHPLAPTLLQIEMLPDGLADVTWKTSRQVPSGSQVKPVLPAHCTALDVPTVKEEPTFVVLTWRVDCGATGLRGQTLHVDGLSAVKLNALVRVVDPEQGTRTWLLKDSETRVTLDEPPGKLKVALSYMRLGIEHLIFGPDHVLLVIALMLLIGNTRHLLITITAFTVGHSITLSLATLGVVNVPVMPVEVAIAASIMLVAASIPTGSGSDPVAVAKAPWIMAAVFGLLHGFGFAGALNDIGLPQGEIPLALLSFNIGIEVGQIAIVLLMWHLIRWWSNHARFGRAAVTYAIGGMAAFWTLERLLMMGVGGTFS